MKMTQKNGDKWPKLIKSGSSVVKIYRTVDRERERFSLSWHEGGQRKLKQFVSLSDATAEGRVIADLLDDGKGCALELTGADRDAYFFALQKLQPLDLTLVPSISEFVEVKTIAGKIPLKTMVAYYIKHHQTELPKRTIEEVVQELLDAKKMDGLSKRHLDDLRLRLKRFSNDFSIDIASVQSPELNAWLRGLNVSSRTRNNFRGALSNLFSFAKQSGYLPRDTATAIDLVGKVKIQRKRPGIFSPEELSRLLKGCDDTEPTPLKPWIVLGALCGLRSAEVYNLKWEDIRWNQGQIAVGEQNKTGYRFAPLTEAAAHWLRSFKSKTGRLFPLQEMPYQRLKVLCSDAKVVFKENALRHSFGTYRTATTKNLPQVALEMGNSVQVIRSAYDAVMPESEGLAWFNVGLPRKKAVSGAR